jgi:hypothetical protein
MLAGHSPEPHVSTIDGQTASTSEADYDGCKRHLVVNTQTLILHVLAPPADGLDGRTAEAVLADPRGR